MPGGISGTGWAASYSTHSGAGNKNSVKSAMLHQETKGAVAGTVLQIDRLSTMRFPLYSQS
jgi:hypothetical protein